MCDLMVYVALPSLPAIKQGRGMDEAGEQDRIAPGRGAS